ncbi:MAG TPA: NDP-sugar synthase [Syntrophaceae bacterium]|nr:NDP-sugar synthase [Syntrophaceae bacterium]
MKAIILCAGLGTRLKPLTDKLPKPLMPIVGRPIIENIIYTLKHCGIREIVINTHHLHGKIVDYLKDGKKFEIKVHYSYEPQILGTGGGMGNARDFFKGHETFIAHNGDVLTNLNLAPVIKAHIDTQAMATLLLCDFPPINTVTMTSSGEVVGIKGNPKEPKDSDLEMLTFTGISIMNPKILEFLPGREYGDIVDTYLKLIGLKMGSIRGYVIKNHYWRHIGNISEYFRAHQEILIEKKRLIYGKMPSSKPFYIGEGSIIEEGVLLRGFVSVGRDCVIKREATLENCIIWDGITVEEGEVLRNVILGNGMKISC